MGVNVHFSNPSTVSQPLNDFLLSLIAMRIEEMSPLDCMTKLYEIKRTAGSLRNMLTTTPEPDYAMQDFQNRDFTAAEIVALRAAPPEADGMVTEYGPSNNKPFLSDDGKWYATCCARCDGTNLIIVGKECKEWDEDGFAHFLQYCKDCKHYVEVYATEIIQPTIEVDPALTAQGFTAHVTAVAILSDKVEPEPPAAPDPKPQSAIKLSKAQREFPDTPAMREWLNIGREMCESSAFPLCEAWNVAIADYEHGDSLYIEGDWLRRDAQQAFYCGWEQVNTNQLNEAIEKEYRHTKRRAGIKAFIEGWMAATRETATVNPYPDRRNTSRITTNHLRWQDGFNAGRAALKGAK